MHSRRTELSRREFIFEHCFVDQEPPFMMPAMQVLAIDYRYTKAILAR